MHTVEYVVKRNCMLLVPLTVAFLCDRDAHGLSVQVGWNRQSLLLVGCFHLFAGFRFIFIAISGYGDDAEKAGRSGLAQSECIDVW